MNELEIDRLCELTNIGAGHAATAFSQLSGRTIWMHVPTFAGEGHCDLDDRPWPCGVFFEFDGAIAGLVGVLFREPMRESLLASLLGVRDGPYSEGDVESALMEVGNILVSHVASAIADTVGDRILPSLPTLATAAAGERLEELARRRAQGEPTRIECELSDESGEIGGLLVFFPDAARPRQ